MRPLHVRHIGIRFTEEAYERLAVLASNANLTLSGMCGDVIETALGLQKGYRRSRQYRRKKDKEGDAA